MRNYLNISVQRVFFTLVVACAGFALSFAQESTSTHIYRLEFQTASSDIDTSVSDNAANLRKLIKYINNLTADTTVSISEIRITSSASPEGSYEFNMELAQRRLEAVYKVITAIGNIPDSVIAMSSNGIAWEGLRKIIEDSDEEYKDTILSIISREERLVPYYDGKTIDQRVYDLIRLDRGKVWKKLKNVYFPKLRTMYVIDIHHRQYIPFDELPDISKCPIPDDSASVGNRIPIRQMVEHIPADLWQQKLHLKSNGIGWLMLAGNGAVELELSRHWSINLPVYYSDLDYFTREAKFKTLTIQPEVRYWFKDGRNWFAGAHLGIGWFNYALNGDYRIQDCGWDSPALGGGLSGGYRMHLTKSGRWQVEFSLGIGVYDVKYDKFRNVPDGKIVETVHDTWFGIDQAAVSFIYSIGLNRWTR